MADVDDPSLGRLVRGLIQLDLPPKLHTAGEIRAWLEEEWTKLHEARVGVDRQTQAANQRRAERQWVMRFGAFQGMVLAAFRLGHLDDAGYPELIRRARGTVIPTIMPPVVR